MLENANTQIHDQFDLGEGLLRVSKDSISIREKRHSKHKVSLILVYTNCRVDCGYSLLVSILHNDYQ